MTRTKGYKQLNSLREYAEVNEIKLNFKKNKLMLFNTGKNLDFMPSIEIDHNEIELVEEMRILGLIIRSDLKWTSNTEQITIKAFKRLWVLRRLKALGASQSRLLDVYCKQVRSVMELAVPAWHPGLTVSDALDIERVQKASLQIILGTSYTGYAAALDYFELDTLEGRRVALCEKFGKKAAKNDKHCNWFKPNRKKTVTRQTQPKFCPVASRTRRFDKSPLSYLTKLLNKYSK